MVGFFLVLLSSICFAFQNVVVRILFNEQRLLGVVVLGGYVTPTLQNSFLLMFMRMLSVVPLMAILAAKLYPPTWQELRQLVDPKQRPLLRQSLGCGLLMFLYLALLYIAIGMIPTGIAMTLFFTYPAFTALFSWQLFGDRPSWFRWMVMGIILGGSALTMPHISPMPGGNSLIGILTGIASGITYALYAVIAQKCFAKVHPVPFTWLSFAITLGLSGICLLVWRIPTEEIAWTPLWIGGLVSGFVTFAAHLLNNIGIRSIGATAAAMVAASNPAITVLLAWLAIAELISRLQLVGVIIATLGITLLSLERIPRSPTLVK